MNQLLLEILKNEGVATLSTYGNDEQHLTATWNSYIEVDKNNNLLIPVGGYHKTERNINSGSQLLMLIGSKNVEGKHSMGTGMRLKGSAKFIREGEVFENKKKRFNWIRALLVFTPEKIEQLL